MVSARSSSLPHEQLSWLRRRRRTSAWSCKAAGTIIRDKMTLGHSSSSTYQDTKFKTLSVEFNSTMSPCLQLVSLLIWRWLCSEHEQARDTQWMFSLLRLMAGDLYRTGQRARQESSPRSHDHASWRSPQSNHMFSCYKGISSMASALGTTLLINLFTRLLVWSNKLYFQVVSLELYCIWISNSIPLAASTRYTVLISRLACSVPKSPRCMARELSAEHLSTFLAQPVNVYSRAFARSYWRRI